MGKVEIEFNNLLGELNDNEFWGWIREWLSEDYIMDVINNWNDDTKKKEINNLKKILKGGKDEKNTGSRD